VDINPHYNYGQPKEPPKNEVQFPPAQAPHVDTSPKFGGAIVPTPTGGAAGGAVYQNPKTGTTGQAEFRTEPGGETKTDVQVTTPNPLTK
jgi:hypothetical protein